MDGRGSQAAAPRDGAGLERVLLELAVGFVNVPVEQLDAAISDTLATVGELSGAARSYLFTYDWDRGRCSNTHEWCAPGVSPVIGDLQEVPITELHDWTAMHRAGRVVHRPDISAPGLDQAERQVLESQGVTALIALPLMVDDACVGFVGLDAVDGPREWSDRDLELLEVLANLLAQAEERRSLERARRAAVELAEANEHLTNFAGAVSHDLKAPLTTVQGLLTLLRDGDVDADRAPELLDRAITASGRMAAMIDRLLNYAAAGREIGAAVPVELDRVVTIARELLAGRLAERGGRVDAAALPAVRGDELRLVEVFQNLIGNALVHVPADRTPVVTIRGLRTGGTVTVTVRDNGDGIDASDRDRLVRSFERGDGSRGDGIGMGLPLCARIVAAHGGTFRLSDAPEGGLEVVMQLPAADPG